MLTPADQSPGMQQYGFQPALIPTIEQHRPTVHNAQRAAELGGERIAVQTMVGFEGAEAGCLANKEEAQRRPQKEERRHYKRAPFPPLSNQLAFPPLPQSPNEYSTQVMPRPQENKRKALRVCIRDKEILACPDSRSEKNIMSEAFASEQHLLIHRNPRDIARFELGSGKEVWSTGRVRTNVKLLRAPLRRKQHWFYVFVVCPVPVIMGMTFLVEAGTLTVNKHLLESCPAPLSGMYSLLWRPNNIKKRGHLRPTAPYQSQTRTATNLVQPSTYFPASRAMQF
jgi:hypothetical protein